MEETGNMVTVAVCYLSSKTESRMHWVVWSQVVFSPWVVETEQHELTIFFSYMGDEFREVRTFLHKCGSMLYGSGERLKLLWQMRSGEGHPCRSISVLPF